MTATRSSTWLITGASSGIGKSLALEALKPGARVVGTSRDVNKAEMSFPEFTKRGGIWLALDAAQKDAFERFSKCATEYDIDVLINSAGYALIGGVEDTRSVFESCAMIVSSLTCTNSEDEVREQMEVNFYGPLRAVRACLPVMRSNGFGNLVLISSGAGKFAIEAVYESLSHEVKTFGVKVLIVEPGAFRTPFASKIRTPAQYQVSNGFSEAYKGTEVEQMVNGTVNIMSIPDFVKGDPDKAARAIANAVIEGHAYLN
ncbi:hypothetical protein BTUL_0153g00200 [Botrytis tulipae]|uniref:Uncharacterized protein n=1 Tax=Botrytis tulipae TaxID=87230 RepID=A0A4Z1EBY0_9HELO|nr:hypothetical protein BTUL_0153g00200 [Botrytis tulipae]